MSAATMVLRGVHATADGIRSAARAVRAPRSGVEGRNWFADDGTWRGPGRLDAATTVDLAFNTRGLRPRQSRWEFERLVELVARRQPSTVLEIGTANGGSLFAWCRSAAPDAIIASVDMPSGVVGTGYSRSRSRVLRSLAAPDQTLHLLRGDSHGTAMLDQVASVLDGRPLDFLFIDGDHSYEGVRCDVEMYGPLLAPQGLMALHDVTPNRWNPTIGVDRYWADHHASSPASSVISDPRGWQRYGIGLVTGNPGAR